MYWDLNRNMQEKLEKTHSVVHTVLRNNEVIVFFSLVQQAHSKYAKAKQTLDLCESSYQSSVTSVEEARKTWEKARTNQL